MTNRDTPAPADRASIVLGWPDTRRPGSWLDVLGPPPKSDEENYIVTITGSNLSAGDVARRGFEALSFVGEVMRAWSCDDEAARRTLGLTGKSGHIDLEVLEGIAGCILAIAERSSTVMPGTEDMSKWLKTPTVDHGFGGKQPVEYLTSGRVEDLMRILHYFENWTIGGSEHEGEASASYRIS